MADLTLVCPTCNADISDPARRQYDPTRKQDYCSLHAQPVNPLEPHDGKPSQLLADPSSLEAEHFIRFTKFNRRKGTYHLLDGTEVPLPAHLTCAGDGCSVLVTREANKCPDCTQEDREQGVSS